MRSKIFQTMNLRESETIALKVSQKNHYRDGTFVFFPQEDIKVQIQLFFKMCKKGIWNREISIEHYKGTFKVEHFQMIETQFRVISPLRKISIINTQMDKEHMIVLRNLLQWLRPKKFEVELTNNELDDEDLQEFFFYVLESDLDLQKLFIISNPGIFKGRLLKEIKQKFPKRFSPIQVIFYRLILNKEYKSVALVQLQQKKDKQEIKNYIDEQQNILEKTCFYELNLSGCFTEQNYKGFINLINLSYDQDNLEQIQALDVSNNYLGDLNSFTTACSLISTAKGLLELKFRQVEQMKSSAAALALIGDRYDKLRINCFDISQNKFDSTKTLNILSNSIFLHCQEIHLKNIFQDEIFKYPAMQALNNAFLAMQKQFKEESVQSGYLKQYTLEELDLNVLESNQRSDLYQDLLNYLVFSGRSNIKKLSCLNLKDKVNLYVESALSFKDRIKAAKSHHFYLHQFRLPLKQVIIQLEENINIDLLFQLFQEFCFTQSQDPIQIKHVKIDGTNLDYYSRVNISDIFVNILNLNNQATYTLKSIELFDARTKMPIEIYQFLLLNEQIHLKGLTIIKDRFEENFSNYYQKTLKFLQTIPSKILSLQNLCLKDIKGEQLDICQLINLFFYNIQIRLKRLEIQNLQWSFNDTQKLNLQEQINNQSEGFEFSIKELTFGEFQDSSAEYYFYNYVLLTNFQKLKRLTLLKNSLEKNIQNIYKLFRSKQFTKNPFETLNYFCLKHSRQLSFSTWCFLLKNILFANNSALQEIVFCKLTINSEFKQAFTKITKKRNPPNPFNKKGVTFQLEKISFSSCNFEAEFISSLLMLNCHLKTIEIIQCVGLDKTVTQSKLVCEQYHKFKNIIEFNLEHLIIQDCNLTQNNFKWFMENLVWKRGQILKLKTLNLKNSQIDDHKLQYLTELLQLSKQNVNDQMITLRTINLQDNDQISETCWNNFFYTLITFQQKNEKLMKHSDIRVQIQEQDNINALAKMDSYQACQQLRIEEKIRNIHHTFKPLYYENLKILSLQMEFSKFSMEQKEFTYLQIIKTFIINQQSQVKVLKLVGIDLKIFINSMDASLKQNFLFNSQIQDLNVQLSQITEITQTNVNENLKFYSRKFINIFFESNSFDLQILTLSKFDKAEIISSLLILPLKTYSLKKISLIGVEEELSDSLTIQFIEDIFTCQKFKIESLQLDQNIQFKCWGLDLGGIVKKISTQSPLQEFTATIDSEQIDFYAQVLQFLFTKNNQLKKLDINLEKDSNFNDLFSNLFNYQNNQLSLNFRIEELILNGKLIFDSEMFLFLLLLMNRLRLLEISDVVFEPSSLLLQNLKECEQRRQRENSLLRIKYISNQEGIEIKDFMEYFIFNDKFGFEQVEVQDKYSFVQTKIIQNCSKLKSIKLHMRPQERKQQLWDFNVFTSFSKSFIYNLESNCEEICFYNFEFTNNEINALIQPAKQFKQLLNGFNNNNQNKLNLKKFSLRHSRNLIDENIEKIIDNLIFFEYIFLKELTLSDINLNNKTCQFLVDAANQWMKQHRGKSVSQNLKLPLKILDLSQNHFIQNQETWENLLKRFIFTLEAKLKAFIISDMSLTDKTTECFKNLSEQFFQAQQCKYQLALRALDLSQNYFLSQIGWLNILKYFALSKNVEIVELNMNETTEFENNEEILNQIYKCFEEKANLSQNQKVSIQRVYCQNENLKVLVSKFLAPYNQQQVYYLEQKQRDNFKLGLYYGFGEYFGTKVQTYNQMLKEQNEFIELKKIDSFEDLKLSYYQLNFSKHYLQILNNYYKELEKNKIDIYLSLLTLKNFCSIFQYPMNEPAEPFPYKLFFQQDTMNFLKSQSSLINRINFIQTDFGNLNLIQQGDIFNIWKQIRETSIDLVIIEYTMNDELCQNMIINGFNERDIIQLIRVLPPSKVRLIGGLSLCAIKGVYSILYEIPHFQHSFTSYEYDLFLNTGIGYSLRESVYQWKERNFIEKIFKRTLYKIFNFFVSSKNKYTFDQEIIKLNQFLKDNQIIFFVIATNNNIFWFVALVFPYLMISKQLKEENETSSDVNCASISYTLVNSIYYFCFSPIFFFIETILFYFFSQTIGNHIDTFEFQFQALADESYDEKDYQFISNIDQQDNEQIIQNHKNIQLKRKTKWFLPQLFFEGDQLMEENLESSIEQPQQTMEPQQTIKSSLNQIYPLQSLAFSSGRYKSGRKIFPQEFLSSRRKSSKIDFGQFKFTKFFKKKWKTIYGKYRPINFLKKKLNELFKSQTGIIVYSFISIIKSQLYKFDLFNDMIFILTCFYCQEVPLFYASILITMLNQLFYLTQFLLTGFSLMKTNDKVRDISTQKINQMYSLALVGRNQAIADLLDKITPFNVSIIPNTYFFRKYFPRYAGKSISNPVMYYFVQFWCEDLPQTVLQAYFAYKQQISDGFLQTQIYIMIITTTFTLLSSFYSFMSIRPSNITQEDFDRLAEQKKAAYHKTIKSWLEEEKKQLEIFSNIS